MTKEELAFMIVERCHLAGCDCPMVVTVSEGEDNRFDIQMTHEDGCRLIRARSARMN